MNKLETLLNSLIKMGWKPWGKEYTAIDIAQDGRDECLMFWNVPKRQMKAYTLRDLVSLESSLWQFVVENKLYKKTNTVYEKHFWIGEYKNFYDVHYQYRLIESALVPEEELGKFLVDNIKLEWTD